MATKPKNQDNEGGSNLPSTYTPGSLPADLSDELAGLTGLGYSNKAEDSLVPILAILQDNSAEVKRGHSRYMPGALAGYLIIRSLKRVIQVDAQNPLVVQPCGFQHLWVRWKGEPGEGQITGQYPYDERPAEAEEKQLQDDDERMTWVMPDGSRLVDTRYHYCHAFLYGQWVPVVIPFAGTNHTASRTWTNIQKAQMLPNGAKCPAWFKSYTLATKFNERGTQSWYTYDVGELGYIADRAQRDLGRAMFESLGAGVISADVRSEGQQQDEDLQEEEETPAATGRGGRSGGRRSPPI